MGEQGSGNLDLYLKIGLPLSIQGKSKGELPATVAKISPRKLGLELPRPTSQFPFQEGERVGVRYWDRGAVVYYWNAKVVEISGLRDQKVAISMGRRVVVQRWRSLRVGSPIPFSFTVIGAAQTQLVSKKVANSTTQNISGGGLAFETPLPLKVGDHLEMNLQSPSTSPIEVDGWVVCSRLVERYEKDLHSIALMFLQLEEREQGRLLKFLAQSQGSEWSPTRPLEIESH